MESRLGVQLSILLTVLGTALLYVRVVTIVTVPSVVWSKRRRIHLQATW